MAFRPGTGATFTKAMATAGINIRAIAQVSSYTTILLYSTILYPTAVMLYCFTTLLLYYFTTLLRYLLY